jgi:uncharacterized protein (TIGR02246 family)
MAVSDIHKLHAAFTEAFNAHDIESLLELYEVDATMVPQPGMSVSGHDGIRQALTAFLGMGGYLQLDTTSVLVAGNIALLRGSYHLKSGDHVLLAGSTIEVLRRHSDGNWYYVIDNPFPG